MKPSKVSFIMDEYKKKLEQLKEQRKRASQTNFKEVLEENERAKRPANWEKRLERNLKKLETEEARQKAEAAGEDFELKRSLQYRADEIEKWEKHKSQKKNPALEGYVDFEEATRRQYERSVKQIKPDLVEYNAMKNKMGEEKFYLTNGEDSVPKSSLTIDSEKGIDRMVEDTQKQIEIRSKRSRRRRFDDEADVDYINERNMKFNKKLERFYGQYTDEIKKNFERGTAM